MRPLHAAAPRPESLGLHDRRVTMPSGASRPRTTRSCAHLRRPRGRRARERVPLGSRRPAPAFLPVSTADRDRTGTARPRSRRRHPAGDAGRPPYRPGHRGRDSGRVPARRGRPRRETPRALPGRARRRGVLLVRPHLRQRLPRTVAAAPAVHGGQPRPLDAPHRHRPHPRGPAVRRARAACRPQPHRAAHGGRLRSRPGPAGLAVRRRPRAAPNAAPGSASCRPIRTVGGHSPAAASPWPPSCPRPWWGSCGTCPTGPGARTSPNVLWTKGTSTSTTPKGRTRPTAPKHPARTPTGTRARPPRSAPRSAGPASGTAAGSSPGSAPPTRRPGS